MFDDLAKPAPKDETGNRSGDVRYAVPMDDSESKALDQLLAAQGKARGALDKSPTMLAKHSNPDDIVATVGADGQLSMRGVGKLTQAKVEQVQGTNDELQTRMAAIQKEVDPDVRQSLLSSFQADFAEQLSKDVQRHKEVADSQSGVPQLRAQLVASEARDKADPLYYKYQSDSTGTERIRNALMQAENHARVVAKDMVANDPQINRKHSLVTTFLDTENKNLAKLLQRKEATDAQIEQETAGLSEENLKVLAAQYPDKTVEELKRIAYGMKKNPATRNDSAVLLDPSATPEDYATAAAAGMKGALPYVIKEQSARTGTPPEKVRSEIEAMQKLAANDQLLLEAVNKIGTAEEKKKFQDMVFAHKLEKGKDAQLDWHKTKLAWVMDLQGKVAANNLKSDVKNWNPVNGIALKDIPEIKAIIDRYEVQGKQVGVNELMDRYVTDAPKDQQAERFKLIKDFYGSNLDLNNGGIYGKIDKPSAMKALEARFIGTGFLDTLSGDLARFREKASETKPFGISKDNTPAPSNVNLPSASDFIPRSNTDLSAAKVSSWLKEQISNVEIDTRTNNSKADDIYGNVTPRDARLNVHYKEMGTYLDGMDSAVSDRPRLRAAINAAKPSNNVEDRR